MSVQIQAIMLWHIPPGKIFAARTKHYSLNSQADASCQCYNTITEWAACGVACAVVWRYAGLRVREVAADGDRVEKSFVHRFSAAHCWAQAGNFYRALALCDGLLARADLSHRLRQRVEE